MSLFAQIRKALLQHVPVDSLVAIIDGYRSIWDYACRPQVQNDRMIEYASFGCYFNSNMNGQAIESFCQCGDNTPPHFPNLITKLAITFSHDPSHPRLYRNYIPSMHDQHLLRILELNYIAGGSVKFDPQKLSEERATAPPSMIIDAKRHPNRITVSAYTDGFYRRCPPRVDCFHCGYSQYLVYVKKPRSHVGNVANCECHFCHLKMIVTFEDTM